MGEAFGVRGATPKGTFNIQVGRRGLDCLYTTSWDEDGWASGFGATFKTHMMASWAKKLLV